MPKLIVASICGLTALLAGAKAAQAAFSIAYITTAQQAPEHNVDYLNNSGMTVTYLLNPTNVSAASLAQYDAVLIASDSPFSDSGGIGDAAAAFADSGKNVVLTQFDFFSNFNNLSIGGQIAGSGYSPFEAAPTSYNSTSMGTVYTPASPLLAGVNPSGVSTTFASPVGLDASATLVADYANGMHAVAYNLRAGGGAVIGLNLYPDVNFDGASLDAQRLVANALQARLATTATPEPSSVLMVGIGLAGVAGLRLARRSRAA